MQKNRFSIVCTGICVLMLFIGFFSVVVRVGTRSLIKLNVCPPKLAKIIFFDRNDLQINEKINNEVKEIISWKELYPFDETNNETEIISETEVEENTKKNISFSIPIINLIINKIEPWASSNFICRNFLLEIGTWIVSRIVDKNCVKEYRIIDIENGYLVRTVTKGDATEKAQATIDFKNFLESKNIPFLFVLAPFKSDPKDSKLGTIKDFSNENADNFLQIIEKNKIDYIDMRSFIKDSGKDFYSFFYKTDHHWTAESGLWACNILANKLNTMIKKKINTELFNFDNFNFEVYPKSFLGSLGREVTLSNTDMEDFTIITPKYDISLETEIYNWESIIRKAKGGFETLIFKEQLQTKETAYTKSAYAAYVSGDTIEMIKNNSVKNDVRILMLGDSFTDVVEPFLCLGVEQLDSPDLRVFNGSLKSFIEKRGSYDAVILLINAGTVTDSIDYKSHSDLWDFR